MQEAELAKLQTEKAALQAELQAVVVSGREQAHQPAGQQTLAQLFPNIEQAASLNPAIKESANGIVDMLQQLEHATKQAMVPPPAQAPQEQQGQQRHKRAADTPDAKTIEAMLEVAEQMPEGEQKDALLAAAGEAGADRKSKKPNTAAEGIQSG